MYADQRAQAGRGLERLEKLGVAGHKPARAVGGEHLESGHAGFYRFGHFARRVLRLRPAGKHAVERIIGIAAPFGFRFPGQEPGKGAFPRALPRIIHESRGAAAGGRGRTRSEIVGVILAVAEAQVKMGMGVDYAGQYV